MIIKEYDVKNLDCAGCSAKIEGEINNLAEVSSANLDFMNKRLIIQYHENVENALDRLNAIANKIEPGVVLSPKGSETKDSTKQPWFIIAAILVLTLSRFLSPIPSFIVGIVAYIIAGHRVFRAAFKELFSRQIFAEHFLMTIATIGALYLGEFTEAIAVMILYEIGQYLESKAINRSRDSINCMLALKPEIAHRLIGNELADVKVSEINKGETVLVYAGERVPLDGLVTKGESTVDTSSLTGESVPMLVSPGSEVYAGFVNTHTLLEMEVTGNEAESMISRILHLIENASSKKSAPEKFITRFARYYTPAVVVSALLVFLIPTLLGYSSAVWLKRSLIFLIVSCPCALVISIPLSYYIGIGMAAKKGIILKGSVYLDQLRKVNTLVFDKTGTLTTGELQVSEIKPATGISAEELTGSLYICEHTSSHPFAKAIKASFTGEFSAASVQAISEYPGKGLLLQYNNDKLIAGSEDFLRSFGFLSFCEAGDKSVVHAVKNDIYLGCVTFDDRVKAGMKESLIELKKQGIKHISMLSGDREPKAAQVARELGLDSYHASLLPEGKLSMLESIMAATDGVVAYCGDGLNDAPVLARADLGIAMGKIGAQASIETADIVLLNDRPEQLTAAFDLSHKTNRLVWQNVIIALGVKVIIMSFGMAGLSGLWEAIIADVGVTLFVIFNSLRMMRKSHD
jgi:Cd2+/Zn2+-exporting ATPase